MPENTTALRIGGSIGALVSGPSSVNYLMAAEQARQHFTKQCWEGEL